MGSARARCKGAAAGAREQHPHAEQMLAHLAALRQVQRAKPPAISRADLKSHTTRTCSQEISSGCHDPAVSLANNSRLACAWRTAQAPAFGLERQLCTDGGEVRSSSDFLPRGTVPSSIPFIAASGYFGTFFPSPSHPSSPSLQPAICSGLLSLRPHMRFRPLLLTDTPGRDL